MRAILFGGGLSLLISLLGTRYAIRFFTRQGFGQPIRDDGPTTHHVKRGTPTMGGAVVVLATVVGYFAAKLITGQAPTASALLLIFLLVGLGVVGFLDDFLKVSRQHSTGLRSRAKMIGQTVVALVFGGLALSPWLEDENGVTPASKHISFIRDYEGFALPTVVVMVLIGISSGGVRRDRRATNLPPTRKGQKRRVSAWEGSVPPTTRWPASRMGVMSQSPDAQELGAFLKACRARLTPGQVGLPERDGHRKVAGLRREEVASVAAISVDYYTRLDVPGHEVGSSS